MTLINLFAGADLFAQTDGKVLSPAEFSALQSVQDMLAQCAVHCDALQAKTQARMAQQERRGYQRGQQRASAEHAQRILELEHAYTKAQTQQPLEVAELVMTVLEKLAPALGRGELIRALARQAVEHAQTASRVLLKVHPHCADDVEDELDALRRGCAWLDSIEVLAVDGLREDECLLESPHGFVKASWADQLKGIRAMVDGLATAKP
jgi:flagellar biosynthesis/type III secretory pathway protein FliH